MSAAERIQPISLEDLQRERRIKALANQLKAAQAGGDQAEAQRLWSEMRAAVLARSPAQVQRMEQGMGVSNG